MALAQSYLWHTLQISLFSRLNELKIGFSYMKNIGITPAV